MARRKGEQDLRYYRLSTDRRVECPAELGVASYTRKIVRRFRVDAKECIIPLPKFG